jgi:predicted sulfurtransferase
MGISINYDAPKEMVFVRGDMEFTDGELVPLAEAKPDRIIRCSYCEKPANQLDHFFPYHSEYTMCDECKEIKREKEAEGREKRNAKRRETYAKKKERV